MSKEKKRRGGDTQPLKGHRCGRRGRKNRKEGRRKERQSHVNEKERQAELAARPPMVARIKPWMLEICSRSKCGLAISGRFMMGHTFMCAEGRVMSHRFVLDPSGRVDLDKLEVSSVEPWSGMSTSQLRSIKERRWHPYRPKNILEIIAEKL